MTEIRTTSQTGWATLIVARIETLLQHSIDLNGKACLVAPGGRTAKVILPLLSKADINWALITVIPSDERWVSLSNIDSNEKLIRETLIQNRAQRAHFISLYNSAFRVEQIVHDQTLCERVLSVKPDVAFLGMGEDGHYASIFPDDSHSDNAHPLCCTIRNDHPRVSLSSTYILQSKNIIIAVNGEAKKATLDEALKSNTSRKLPIQQILNQHATPVEVFISEI